MNNIKSLLMKNLSNTKAKIWHLVSLLTIVWIIPAFLPSVIWQNYTLYIIAAWVILYLLLARTLRTVLRLTSHDAILIERYFIFLSFLVSFVYGLIYGLSNTFDTVLIVCLVLSFIVTSLLFMGIVIHLKTSKKYYHGVAKDELFK